MTHRELLKPYVVMSPRDDMVCSKTPVTSPEDFYETFLTVAEARLYALELMIEADRVEQTIAINKRLKKR